MWVAEVNGRSVGFLQDYRIGDYPDYAVLAPDPDAIGVDYAIGEPAWSGRGLGARVLWAWMLRARHRLPRRDDVLRGARPPQRGVAADARQGRASPRASGSTSRRRTARVDDRGRLHASTCAGCWDESERRDASVACRP